MTTNLGRRVFKHGLVFTATILTCAALQANDHNDTASSSSAEKFVQKALKGGQMEVQMGQLAQQKGQSQDVKSLGQTLVRDHTQANQRLQQIASSKNITVSQADLGSGSVTTSVTTDHSAGAHAKADVQGKHAKAQHEMTKLQGQSGQEFDKAFVRMAVKDHKKDISEFERARTEVNDPEIKAFIDETLPKLRQHLQMAKSAARTVGVDEASIAAESDYDNDNDAVGGAAAGTVGTRGSDKPGSPASNPENKDRSSIDSSRLNGATDTDASGTIRNNNPRADLDANVGDHSVSADVDVDKDDHSVSADVDTDKNGKVFQKGDGKVLGLSTDKNDGKFLGIIPDPIKKDEKKHDASINADVDVNGHDASVGAAASTETGSSSDTK